MGNYMVCMFDEVYGIGVYWNGLHTCFVKWMFVYPAVRFHHLRAGCALLDIKKL